MLALFVKVPKIQRPKVLKIDVFDYSTVISRPISMKPPRISTYLIIARNYSHWVMPRPTSSPLIVMGLSFSFKFLWWAPKSTFL